MNSARSVTLLLLCGGLYMAPSLAADPSPAYVLLQKNVADNIAAGTYIPTPTVDWSETCDGTSATCSQPTTAFNTFKSSTAGDAAAKAEPKNWDDPYDPKEFGQNPTLDKPQPEYEKDYKWWYESK
jgi:hypothetical protein